MWTCGWVCAGLPEISAAARLPGPLAKRTWHLPCVVALVLLLWLYFWPAARGLWNADARNLALPGTELQYPGTSLSLRLA
jgi:hypothetical protein